MATIKQKKAFDNVVENGGNISKAMKDAGYSNATSHTPQKLTESVGWKELMETYLPDSLLGEKHRELLEVPKKVRHYKKGELESEYEELDSQAISRGLDMAYKLKGKYAPEKVDQHTKIEGTITSDPAIAKEFDEFLKQKKS